MLLVLQGPETAQNLSQHDEKIGNFADQGCHTVRVKFSSSRGSEMDAVSSQKTSSTCQLTVLAAHYCAKRQTSMAKLLPVGNRIQLLRGPTV